MTYSATGAAMVSTARKERRENRMVVFMLAFLELRDFIKGGLVWVDGMGDRERGNCLWECFVRNDEQ